RHTRSYGDWSSDVCSSDLSTNTLVWCGLDYSEVKMIGTLDFRQPAQIFPGELIEWNGLFMKEMMPKLEVMSPSVESDLDAVKARSEERRVGKEGRCGGWTG